MADIYIRGVSDDHKRSLAMLAASLDISLNTLCMWILEEAAMPYDELRFALQRRAEEVHDKRAVYDMPTTRIPAAQSDTQPFPRRSIYSPRRGQRPIILPEHEQ